VFHRMTAGVALVVVVMLCAPAAAENILNIDVLVQWGRSVWHSDDHAGSVRVTPNGDGTYTVKFYGYVPGQWSAMWNLTADPDPVLDGLFTFTNYSTLPGRFQVIVDMPGVNIPTATAMSGSIAGTILDRNGDGATVSAPIGSAIYGAMIDGTTVRKLLPEGASCWAPSHAANAFGPQTFTNEVGPPVTQGLAILHDFILTPGDSITIASSFVVTPEPAGVLLVAVGLAWAFSRGRRRR
jgi:hypothetical protein